MPQLDQQIIPSQDPIHRDIFRNSLVVQNISPIIRHDASQNILCSKKKTTSVGKCVPGCALRTIYTAELWDFSPGEWIDQVEI